VAYLSKHNTQPPQQAKPGVPQAGIPRKMFSFARPGTRRQPFAMHAHSHIDRRSLEMDRVVARRIQENPQLLAKVRETLRRWIATASPAVRPTLLEWEQILDGPADRLHRTLTGDDEDSTRLRQSSPFCGILTQAERTEILLRHK